MGPEITGTVPRVEGLLISEGARVTKLIEDLEGEYWRGEREDFVDRARSPFKGAKSNLLLYLEFHPELQGLVFLSGESIGLGNSGWLRRFRIGKQVVIGSLGLDVGLRISGEDAGGFQMPFIKSPSDLISAATEHPNAVRSFGELTHLEMLGRIRVFAERHASKRVPRIPLPSSSGK